MKSSAPWIGLSCRTIAWLASGTLASGQAPIVHDGTLGPAGAVPRLGNEYRIEPGNGRQVGSNLFHSFSDFGVPTGTTASFLSNPGTRTILARVTGGAASHIDGTLKTAAANTSLFLMNPAGVIFGDGARLEVTGNFQALAGDYLRLEDGSVFWADPGRAVSLSTAPVSDFGFAAASPGLLQVEGSTLETPGHLSLVGRRVEVADSQLRGGDDVFLAAMGDGNGEVRPAPVAPEEVAEGAMLLEGSSIRSGGLGTVLSMRAGDLRIRASELNRRPGDLPLAADVVISSSGDITIDGGSSVGSISANGTAPRGIEVRAGGRLALDDAAIITISRGSAAAADVNVVAWDLHISGNGGSTVSGITSNSFSTGAGGRVAVTIAGLTEMDRAGMIGTIALDAGDAGSIRLETGSLHVVGLPENGPQGFDFLTGIVGISQGSGRGGQITVDAAEEIVLTRGGLIDSSSFGPGSGGGVRVSAPVIQIDRAGGDFFTGIGSDAIASGAAGAVEVEAGSLELRNGGLISTSTESTGDAGNILVSADRIVASGTGTPSVFVLTENSGIAAGSTSTGADSGRGGSIDIRATELTLSDGAEVLARSQGGGAGGSIRIDAADLRLLSGARVTSEALGSADAGEIRALGGDLDVDADSLMSVLSEQADAGLLILDYGGSVWIREGALTASAGVDGGNIEISAGDFIFAKGAQVRADAGRDGGNITFRNARHLVLDDSSISASAIDRTGGRIEVDTGTFFANRSTLSVTSEQGTPGTIDIQTLASLTDPEVPDDPELTNPGDVIRPDCVDRLPDVGSSFVQAGKGGVAPSPGAYLPSLRILE